MGGSFTNTSKAALATWPDSKFSFKASSSTNPPLAQFTIRTPFFILEKDSLPIIFFVFSVRGVCKVIKSDRLNKSSKDTFSTPNSSAFLSCKKGSNANTLNCKPKAR